MMGFAVMLAVVLGVGTTALAAVPGDPFKLGKANAVNALTSLPAPRTTPCSGYTTTPGARAPPSWTCKWLLASLP
jgi:hypothetical protein